MDVVEQYALLRRTGQIIVPATDASAVVPGLRRRAKADGLRLMSHKIGAKGMSPNQRRTRGTVVNLTDALGTTIVAPDAEAGA